MYKVEIFGSSDMKKKAEKRMNSITEVIEFMGAAFENPSMYYHFGID